MFLDVVSPVCVLLDILTENIGVKASMFKISLIFHVFVIPLMMICFGGFQLLGVCVCLWWWWWCVCVWRGGLT